MDIVNNFKNFTPEEKLKIIDSKIISLKQMQNVLFIRESKINHKDTYKEWTHVNNEIMKIRSNISKLARLRCNLVQEFGIYE